MAIAPKDLQQFAGGEDAEEPTSEDVEEATESDEEAEAEVPVEEAFPTLYPLMEANGEALEEILSPLDPTLLSDPASNYAENEGELNALSEILVSLPEDLQAALAMEAPAEYETCLEMAQQLEENDHIVNADVVAGFLFHGGALAVALAGGDEEVVEEDEVGDPEADVEDAEEA
jgi:hypothetical protein